VLAGAAGGTGDAKAGANAAPERWLEGAGRKLLGGVDRGAVCGLTFKKEFTAESQTMKAAGRVHDEGIA
jgi:hypothetical protein